MSENSGSGSASLPEAANLDWLRKQAKRRLQELCSATPDAKLADAQFDVAKQYGFSSWRALKSHVDSLTVDGQLLAATRSGDADRVAALLDQHPEKLAIRAKPYSFTLLHIAAQSGRLSVVDLLIRRGQDVNVREKGDNTYPMHWAAAVGNLDVVRRLADAGGEVVGHGDDHELEVIGWATCWDGCDDDAHREVADFLISRGAHHHIFSAIAMNLADEVRRIVRADPTMLSKRMSHNENHQRPLHFAVRKNNAEMVALLLDLGADPAETDDSGMTAAMYAAAPNVDGRVLETLAHHGAMDLFTALALGDDATAERLMATDRMAMSSGGANAGALHLLAKRGDIRAVQWLLDHGADPNARWSHWDADVTPLHLAAWQGHADVVRLLLGVGADPTIRDSKHDGDALGWAEHGGQLEVVKMLRAEGS